MKIIINKKLAAVAWLTMLSAVFLIFWHSGMSPDELAQAIKLKIGLLGPWGPLAYVVGYSLRSLVFFPASLLTALGGVLFGPLLGIILTIVGENISANLSFTIGRYFGAEALIKLGSASGIISRMTCGVQRNGFIAVMTMRLTYLPFDLVGYGCGMCNVRRWDFILGTLLGTIPGLATFILLGSAVADYRYIMVAAAAVVSSLVLARYVKNKQKRRDLYPA